MWLNLWFKCQLFIKNNNIPRDRRQRVQVLPPSRSNVISPSFSLTPQTHCSLPPSSTSLKCGWGGFFSPPVWRGGGEAKNNPRLWLDAAVVETSGNGPWFIFQTPLTVGVTSLCCHPGLMPRLTEAAKSERRKKKKTKRERQVFLEDEKTSNYIPANVCSIHVLKPPLLQPSWCHRNSQAPWDPEQRLPDKYLIQITGSVCTAFDKSLIDTL